MSWLDEFAGWIEHEAQMVPSDAPVGSSPRFLADAGTALDNFLNPIQRQALGAQDDFLRTLSDWVLGGSKSDPSNPGTAQSSDGQDPSLQSPSGLTTATRVPMPFDSQYFQDADRTEVFGQQGPGGSTEYGNDYAMPVGTKLFSPFAGTISTEDDGKSNWGKRVFVTLSNGWKFAIGHMTGFAVADGQQITAGSLLGYSGGDPGDPSSGMSTGPHVELQMIDPNGRYNDPLPMLQQIYQAGGVTFKDLAGGGFLAAGTGLDAPPPDKFYFTPDGHKVQENSPDDRWYNMINSVWKKVYGANAPYYAAQALAQTGVQNMDQVQSILDEMPSDIPGLSMGQREKLKGAAQSAADKWLGRPVPDALIAQFAAEGKTSPIAIEEWFHSHSSTDIPRDQYTAVWDSMNQWTQSLTGQPPHPDAVVQAWKGAGGQLPTSIGPDTNQPFIPQEDVTAIAQTGSPVAGMPGPMQ